MVPTIDPQSSQVDVFVVYTINGPSYSDYQNSKTLYSSTLTLAIINATNNALKLMGVDGYVSSSNLVGLIILPPIQTLSSSITPVSSIQVSYTIQSSMVINKYINTINYYLTLIPALIIIFRQHFRSQILIKPLQFHIVLELLTQVCNITQS
jgi:hypothetical protein